MSSKIYNIEGFKELRQKIKGLPDKVKKREVVKILRQAAKSTLTAARSESPVSKRNSTVHPRENLKKSIKIRTLTRAKMPMVVVGPASRGKNDGFYGRLFVIPGFTNKGGTPVAANPFMARAEKISKRAVSNESVSKVEKYLKKQIDRL